jgi:hypothetical protein
MGKWPKYIVQRIQWLTAKCVFCWCIYPVFVVLWTLDGVVLSLCVCVCVLVVELCGQDFVIQREVLIH